MAHLLRNCRVRNARTLRVLNRTIVVGQNPFDVDQVGYSGSVFNPYGSVSDDQVNGESVLDLVAEASGGGINPDRIFLRLTNGTLAQSFFTTLRVEDTSGVIRAFLSANADSFTQSTISSPPFSLWIWNTPSDLVWVGSDDGLTKGWAID